eukprot:GFUD01131306.1.p1 GENE.GFUD01131306.1~~GFUD01131306.1.p1  ORF type:complete len:575 (+),score=52.98 GFUD01131306.1:32-1726(+)
MYAIFCTMSNDLGIGVPLLNAAFGDNHIYVSYLYLTSAISLLVLNPVGFILLEANKKTGVQKSAWKSLPLVFKGLALNPFVASTVLGVIGNFVFQGQLPLSLYLLLSKLGAAFVAIAPFTLGLGMVGKFKHIKSSNLPTLLGLLIIKCLISPISSYYFVAQFHVYLYEYVDGKLLNFAFLYGTFPTALSVASFGVQYNVSPELISAGIVLCTMISAPLMFVSAEILTVLQLNIEDGSLVTNMKFFDFNIAVASIIGIFIILGIFFFSRKFLSMPHNLTTSLLLQCLVGPISSMLWFFNLISYEWQEIFHSAGVFSVQITTAVLSVVLLMIIQKRTISILGNILCVVTGPVFSAIVMLLCSASAARDEDQTNMENTTTNENIVAVAVNLLSLLVTSTALALIHRLKRIKAGKSNLSSEDSELESSHSKISDQTSDSQISDQTSNSQQIFRHSLLLMVMCCSMVAGVTLPLWRLSTKHLATDTGAFKVMFSLSKILSTGQGLLVVSIFFLDWEFILTPIARGLQWIRGKIKGEKEEVPQFPVMMPVVLLHNIVLDTMNWGVQLQQS